MSADARSEVEKVYLQIMRRRRPDLVWRVVERPATPAPVDTKPLDRRGTLTA